jgi:hypothetical protein
MTDIWQPAKSSLWHQSQQFFYPTESIEHEGRFSLLQGGLAEALKISLNIQRKRSAIKVQLDTWKKGLDFSGHYD